jgi:hypothetical protein
VSSKNVHVLIVVHVGAEALPVLGSVRVAACARRSRRSDRRRSDMLAKGPWSARACLARARALNGVRGFSRFELAQFCFRVRLIAPRAPGAGGRCPLWDGHPPPPWSGGYPLHLILLRRCADEIAARRQRARRGRSLSPRDGHPPPPWSGGYPLHLILPVSKISRFKKSRRNGHSGSCWVEGSAGVWAVGSKGEAGRVRPSAHQPRRLRRMPAGSSNAGCSWHVAMSSRNE